MVLLENFGDEPFTVKFGRFNCSKFVCLLPRRVAQPMMPGIPKFRKESHPERAKDQRRPIHLHLNSYYRLTRQDKRASGERMPTDFAVVILLNKRYPSKNRRDGDVTGHRCSECSRNRSGRRE